MKTEPTTGAEVDEISYRLFIKDTTSSLRFLIDTGANVSVLPARACEEKKAPSTHLYAANGSAIPAYGERSLTLNIGIRRPLRWSFVIAAVSRPIIGADFLRHHNLIVDLRERKLIDKRTNLFVTGSITPSTFGSIRTIDDSQPYHDLLEKYIEITRPNAMTSCNSQVEHHIETTGPPVFAGARPLPPHKYKIAKEEFQSMMNQGICRPSNSPWASPLHMVVKKDGKYRLCGDYRKLNSATVPDRYPLPRLHDFTFNLQDKKIFSKIDLQKAYYQIRNREEDIKKTAVITPFGLFEFTKMCFGLRNAGQTFQRHIDNILRDLPVFPFVDDILVSSINQEEHRRDLEEVFKRLRDHGLQINVAKCVFGQTSLDFLGYTISCDGIKPTEEKIKSITAYPLPETVHDLRRFLGMINFYRESIPMAADRQKELNQYLHNSKKNDKTKIQWNEKSLDAFNKCKEDIKQAVLLSYPSSTAPFALMTDASNTCAGAVLQQKTPNGHWKPLGFYSKKFNEAQQKYSTFDRELLSIYMAVKYFRRMCEGQDLIIYTDHKPLTGALTANSKNETPRRTRYLEYIGQFTTNIQHVPGEANPVADALSRVEAITCPTPIDYATLAKCQQEDKELKILRLNERLQFKSLHLPGITEKITCDTSTGTPRPYLPQEYRRIAFQAIHDLNHPGIRTTRKMIATRFLWPSMNHDVTNWTRTCIPCQRAKVQQHTKAPIASFEKVDRLYHVHLDIVGPLPTSDGCRYLLTMIDRASKWPEAYPIEDITAERVAHTFYSGWISRYGCPAILTTDQGRQFESDLFNKLMQRMGVHRIRTTAYHPQANGMIERWHRTLKTALTTKLNSTNWSRELPTVLLGLRASIKEDIGKSAAELLYGQALRLPGEYYGEKCRQKDSPSQVMNDLNEALKKAQIQRNANSTQAFFIHEELPASTHVFVRNDASSKPLVPTYNGPYRVIERHDKFYNIALPQRNANISIDRLKPAFCVNTRPRVEEEGVKQQYVTRSGRISKAPVRFASEGVL